MPVKGPAMPSSNFLVTGLAISCNTAAHRSHRSPVLQINYQAPVMCGKNYPYAHGHLYIQPGQFNHLRKNDCSNPLLYNRSKPTEGFLKQ
jgi:hypothetical protein